jgi:hypothetical protein
MFAIEWGEGSLYWLGVKFWVFYCNGRSYQPLYPFYTRPK